MHSRLLHERRTSSINEPVNLRSRLWVQCSLRQPSLLNDASTHPPLLLSPGAKANLKRKDNASTHSQLWGKTHISTSPHRLSHTHRKHILTIHPQLCLSAPRFSCQWVYIFSPLWMFSRRRAVQSLLTECHSDVHRHVKHFVFTLFGFTLSFVPCHFLVLSPDLFFKETT